LGIELGVNSEAKKMEDDIDSMRQQISGADHKRFIMSKEEKLRF
jgi:hypothetical protein